MPTRQLGNVRFYIWFKAGENSIFTATGDGLTEKQCLLDKAIPGKIFVVYVNYVADVDKGQ